MQTHHKRLGEELEKFLFREKDFPMFLGEAEGTQTASTFWSPSHCPEGTWRSSLLTARAEVFEWKLGR